MLKPLSPPVQSHLPPKKNHPDPELGSHLPGIYTITLSLGVCKQNVPLFSLFCILTFIYGTLYYLWYNICIAIRLVSLITF